MCPARCGFDFTLTRYLIAVLCGNCPVYKSGIEPWRIHHSNVSWHPRPVRIFCTMQIPYVHRVSRSPCPCNGVWMICQPSYVLHCAAFVGFHTCNVIRQVSTVFVHNSPPTLEQCQCQCSSLRCSVVYSITSYILAVDPPQVFDTTDNHHSTICQCIFILASKSKGRNR